MVPERNNVMFVIFLSVNNGKSYTKDDFEVLTCIPLNAVVQEDSLGWVRIKSSGNDLRVGLSHLLLHAYSMAF